LLIAILAAASKVISGFFDIIIVGSF